MSVQALANAKQKVNNVWPRVLLMSDGELILGTLGPGSTVSNKVGCTLALASVEATTSPKLTASLGATPRIHCCQLDDCKSTANVSAHAEAWAFLPPDFGPINLDDHHVQGCAGRCACSDRCRRVLSS